MNRQLSNISILILALLSLSLVLSTMHSHDAFQAQFDQHERTVPHAVDNNTIVCPVCGYLFKAQLTPAPATGISFFAEEPVTALAAPQIDGPILINRNGRSPPLLS